MIVVMALVDQKEFGQFSSLFRKNGTCQSYFTITLIYRIVLGASLSHQNEVEESTIVNVFFGIFNCSLSNCEPTLQTSISQLSGVTMSVHRSRNTECYCVLSQHEE